MGKDEEKDIPDDILRRLVQNELEEENATQNISQATQFKIPREILKELTPLGISNIFVIYFDENFGPLLYIYSVNDDIVQKVIDRPDFGAEIVILAKHASELTLKDGRMLIIRDLIIENKQYYLFLVVKKGFLSPRPLKLAKNMASEIKKVGRIDPDTIIMALRNSLVALEKAVLR